MEPLTIIGYIAAALVVAIPIAYNYSKKLALALSFIYELLNVVSSFMKGDLDHEFTPEEKIDLADQVIPLCRRIHDNINIDAILNFKRSWSGGYFNNPQITNLYIKSLI